MFRLLLCCLLAFGFIPATAVAETKPPTHWEEEIRQLEERDRQHPPSTNGVLFVGSSSIRLWTNLAASFPEWPVIQHGFGGSHLSDSIHFADRLILVCRPRTVILYAGDNDLADGKSPQTVLADFRKLVANIHATLPETTVWFISIKPSIKRWNIVEMGRKANGLIDEWTRRHPHTGYIDIFTPMLGEDGRPRPELFIEDKLHVNAEGYALWAKVIQTTVAHP